MSFTKLQIYNAALSAVGAKSRLASLEDVTKGRYECDTWFDIVARTAMEAARWSCCLQIARLTRTAERDFNTNWQPGSPEPEFSYAYDLPSDLLRPWYLAGYQRFNLSFDQKNNRQILSTSEANAVLYYTTYQTNVWAWDSGLASAIIHGLAAAIAVPLTGDQAKLRIEVQLADQMIQAARETNANFGNTLVEVIPEELLARGYADARSSTNYYYPLGKLFSAAVPNA